MSLPFVEFNTHRDAQNTLHSGEQSVYRIINHQLANIIATGIVSYFVVLLFAKGRPHEAIL